MARFDDLVPESEVVGDKVEAKILGPPASLFCDKGERVIRRPIPSRSSPGATASPSSRTSCRRAFSCRSVSTGSSRSGPRSESFPVPANRPADACLKIGVAVADHALGITLSTGRLEVTGAWPGLSAAARPIGKRPCSSFHTRPGWRFVFHEK